MGPQFKFADTVSKTNSSVRLQGAVLLITGIRIPVVYWAQSGSAAVQYGTCIICCASPSLFAVNN